LVLVGTVLVFLALGLGITSLMPKQYAASATNFVSASQSSSQGAQLYTNSQYALNQVTSYVELIHSPDVLGPAIRSLGLHMTVNQLARHVSATNPANTVNIVVTASSSSPSQASGIANAVSTNLGTEISALEQPTNGKSSPVKVTLAVPATQPHVPVSPRRSLNLALALFLGVGVGATAAIIRDQLDTTVKSSLDIENEGTGMLGAVRYDQRLRREPLVALRRHDSGVEDFRTIRTNLQFTDVDTPARQIVVSSAVANEGKTLTAVNLAITMAQADLKVCLVEGDLRRPKVTRYLGIDGSLGLSDVVAGLYTVDEVLVPWHRGQLTVLPAGTTPPDPVRLLGSQAAQALFEDLRERFDIVLIDGPPLLPVSDAALLGGTSDGVILIARHHHVRREQFAMAVATLQSVNAKIIGTILTQVPARERQVRYGGSYDYGSTSQPHLDLVEDTDLLTGPAAAAAQAAQAAQASQAEQSSPSRQSSQARPSSPPRQSGQANQSGQARQPSKPTPSSQQQSSDSSDSDEETDSSSGAISMQQRQKAR
jgi:capsular exopolysaccharide synthesis family protein